MRAVIVVLALLLIFAQVAPVQSQETCENPDRTITSGADWNTTGDLLSPWVWLESGEYIETDEPLSLESNRSYSLTLQYLLQSENNGTIRVAIGTFNYNFWLPAATEITVIPANAGLANDETEHSFRITNTSGFAVVLSDICLQSNFANQQPTPQPAPPPSGGGGGATGDCGNGLDCGVLPWDLPALPALESPTPLPTVVVEPTPDESGSPGDPTATPVPPIDPENVDDGLDQAQDLLEATEQVVIDIEGEEFSLSTVDGSEELTGLFGLIRGLTDGTFGVFTPLLMFVFLSLSVTFGIQALSLIIPVAAVVFGIIRKIVTLILDFLPF